MGSQTSLYCELYCRVDDLQPNSRTRCGGRLGGLGVVQVDLADGYCGILCFCGLPLARKKEPPREKRLLPETR